MALCKSCKQEVLWVNLIGARSRMAPLNPTLSREGNIMLIGPKGVTAKVLSKIELAKAREEGELLYTSHFATCPHAASHRKSS